MTRKKKPVGWRGESERHRLAALKGIQKRAARHAATARGIKTVERGTFPGKQKQKHMGIMVWASSRDDALRRVYNRFSPDKWYTNVAYDTGERPGETWRFQKDAPKSPKLYEVSLFERLRARRKG